MDCDQALRLLASGDAKAAEALLWSIWSSDSELTADAEAYSAGWHLLRLLLPAQRLSESIGVLNRLLTVPEMSRPSCARGFATRANAHVALGGVQLALADIDTALALMPDDERMLAARATWRSALASSGEAACAEMRVWAHALQRVDRDGCASNDELRPQPCDTGRRIRVGYVSGDFRNHAARHFIAPILRHHDHARFEIHAFMTHPEDPLTAQFKPWVDHWHDVSTLSEQQLFDEIQRQGIDVLVDLSGHSEGARLGVFARRAAPVQVTWFGYMGTLGLPEMDWRFSDPVVSPVGSEAWHTEKIWHLSSVYAYQAPQTQSIPQVSLPARANGYVTMVCLNHSRKISDASLALWAQLLHANSECGLILISADKSVEYAPSSLNARLRRAGVPEDQVTVVPRLTAEVFMSLSRVADFALDTFPVSGGTTTMLATSMGLPLLALDRDGAGPLESLSARLLMQAGLDGCVAHSPVEYLEKAQAWIDEPSALEALRASLPGHLERSPFMKHAEIAQEVEAAFCAMCERTSY